MKKKIISYSIAIAIPVIVGLLSALLTKDNMNIYDGIIKPKFTPPGVLFPIVWSILYVLMGISSGIIYNADVDKNDKLLALFPYGVQLILNFFWSILFFNQKLFLASFLLLLLLWIFIIVMIMKFWKINRVSAWLQTPYLLWVTFAGYLNLAVYLLN